MPSPTDVGEKEVDEESDSSVCHREFLLTLLGNGCYGDDKPPMYDTNEHFPNAIHLDPHCG